MIFNTKNLHRCIALAAISFLISCMDSSTSNDPQSSNTPSSSQFPSLSSFDQTISSVSVSSSQFSLLSSSEHSISSSVSPSYQRAGYTYQNIDPKLAGVWKRIGSKDSLHLSDTVAVIGNLTKTLKNGFTFRTDMARSIVTMSNGSSAYDTFSFLIAGDTLYFNNPGTNYETGLPNPIQQPLDRLDANTLACLR